MAVWATRPKSFRNGRNYVTHLNVGRFQAMNGSGFCGDRMIQEGDYAFGRQL